VFEPPNPSKRLLSIKKSNFADPFRIRLGPGSDWLGCLVFSFDMRYPDEFCCVGGKWSIGIAKRKVRYFYPISFICNVFNMLLNCHS
jgi:hypothetical protein